MGRYGTPSAHETTGCMCIQRPIQSARRSFHISLAALRLHHGRRSGDPDSELTEVDGSDPRLRDALMGIGRVNMRTPKPPLPLASLPTGHPCGRAVESLLSMAIENVTLLAIENVTLRGLTCGGSGATGAGEPAASLAKRLLLGRAGT